MLEKKEIKMCRFLLNGYSKKLYKYIAGNTQLDPKTICSAYVERFYQYMNTADMGSERGRFTSYLNIYSGLCAYEILCENGLSEEQGIQAYDEMCANMRHLAALMYRTVDLLPRGYALVIQSLKDDLSGPKSICWDTRILQDDQRGFTYEISRCLYFDTCKEHGYPEFCKVFCTHDWYSYGVLKRHARFVRQSTIAKDGTVCHDSVLKVK